MLNLWKNIDLKLNMFDKNIGCFFEIQRPQNLILITGFVTRSFHADRFVPAAAPSDA